MNFIRIILFTYFSLTICYGQTKINFAINSGFVNSYTSKLIANENISFPNSYNLKVGFDFEFKLKPKLNCFVQADLFRHKQKYNILYNAKLSNGDDAFNRSNNKVKYSASNIYNFVVGLSYNYLTINKWSFYVAAGPQIFLQPKTGSLTNGIDSLRIGDNTTETTFVSLTSVSAPNKVNIGYRTNLNFLKSINDKRYFYLGLTFQNSFNVLRESKIVSFKNGNDYANSVGVYKGLSFMITFGYGFKL